MKPIRKQDGTYIIQHDGMPYHVVPKEVDPDNLYDIAALNAEYASNPESFELQADDVMSVEEESNLVRGIRNELLLNSDWTQLPDVPQEVRLAYQSYRQVLRDVPEQEGFPSDVVWPDPPTV